MSNTEPIKLYKFRPLGDELSLCRAKRILETGEFWCSRFWELNDPMEGVFSVNIGNQEVIRQILLRKKKFVICSFSGQEAFSNPVMWGYYANGFKGIAIEIEVSADEVQKIKNMTYADYVAEWSKTDGSDRVTEILTTKLCSWKHEHEYRFLDDSETPGQRRQIGKITGVYFGDPYGTIANRGDIIKESKELRDFDSFRSELESLLGSLPESKKITYHRVNVVDGKVVQQS